MREWVSLKSSLHAAANTRFDCGTCLTSFASHPQGEKALQIERTAKACWGGNVERHVIADSSGRILRFTTCIGNWSSDAWAHWLELHEAYRRGILPYPGSISDQPNKVIEIFRVIDGWQTERQIEAAKKQEAELKRSQPRGGRRGR